MKTRLLLFIAIFSYLNLGHSAGEVTAVKMLDQLQKLYNQRLDSEGNVIQDDAKTQNFINEQNKVIAALKKNKLLGYSFKVTNSFKTDVVVTVTAIQEKGILAGALVESSYYKDAAAEASLRAVGVKGLLKGVDAMMYDGKSLAKIKTQGPMNTKVGGLLLVEYPTDFKHSEYGSINLYLLKSSDGNFAFYKDDRSGFASVYLDIWINIFTRNFGIQDIIFE